MAFLLQEPDSFGKKFSNSLNKSLGEGLSHYRELGSQKDLLRQKLLGEEEVEKRKNKRIEEALGGEGSTEDKLKRLALVDPQKAEAYRKIEKDAADRKRYEQFNSPEGEEPSPTEAAGQPPNEVAGAPPSKKETKPPVKKKSKIENLSNEELVKLQGAGDKNLADEAKAMLELRKHNEEIGQRKFDTAYKAQEDFIKDTTAAYKGFETDYKPRLMQLQKMDPENIISPTANVFLESMGIPLGALDDPSSELYNKVSQDLLKGLPESYGTRILKVEVDNFLKTIPGLMNSPDGRRMIASNMLKLGEMKEVFYNEMRKQQMDAIDSNTPLPRDFEQRIFDQTKPQIDRINNEFVKLADIRSVPPGTTPFFNPSGDVEFVPKDMEQWAIDNGGKRIW